MEEGVAKSSSPTFRTLHALRIKGFATVDVLADMTRAQPEVVRGHLDHLVGAEHARYREAQAMWQLTPTGRDAAVTTSVLGAADLAATACADMSALCTQLEHGVGALLVAEEALRPQDAATLLAVLGRQPPWSDVPIVVLTGEGELSRAIPPALGELASHANVTLLERPVRVATIVTVLVVRRRRAQLPAGTDRPRVPGAPTDGDDQLGAGGTTPTAPTGSAGSTRLVAMPTPKPQPWWSK